MDGMRRIGNVKVKVPFITFHDILEKSMFEFMWITKFHIQITAVYCMIIVILRNEVTLNLMWFPRIFFCFSFTNNHRSSISRDYRKLLTVDLSSIFSFNSSSVFFPSTEHQLTLPSVLFVRYRRHGGRNNFLPSIHSLFIAIERMPFNIYHRENRATNEIKNQSSHSLMLLLNFGIH